MTSHERSCQPTHGLTAQCRQLARPLKPIVLWQAATGERCIILSQWRFGPVIIFLMSEITRVLSAINQGDPRAAAQLMPLVYDELRKLAAQKLAQEKPGQTLEATALVHEAYLRLVDTDKAQQWNSRGHFFAAAAEAMRRILVECARRKGRIKHGGGQRVELDGLELAVELPVDDLLALNEAVSSLSERDSQAAQIVKLHCFAGLTIEQAAEVLGLSARTAYRDWAFARAWLYRAVQGIEPPAKA
jgi:RNA polymerase sigma factor (TIGR02999 family)